MQTMISVSACGKDVSTLVRWQHFSVLMQIDEAEAGQQRAVEALLNQLNSENFDHVLARMIVVGSDSADHKTVSTLVEQVLHCVSLPPLSLSHLSLANCTGPLALHCPAGCILRLDCSFSSQPRRPCSCPHALVHMLGSYPRSCTALKRVREDTTSWLHIMRLSSDCHWFTAVACKAVRAALQVVDKALAESLPCGIYAELCSQLDAALPSFEPPSQDTARRPPTTFRSALHPSLVALLASQ